MKRLAVIITHPIQYYSPLFRFMGTNPEVEVKVFYTWSQTKDEVFDKNFGKTVKWDIPLLDGYEFEFIDNVSKSPSSLHINGIINPGLIPAVTKFEPSSILVFGWNHKSHLELMKHFKGKVPIYFRGDSTLIDDMPALKAVARKLWLTRVYKNVDYAFYVGENNKAYYRKFGLKEEQLIHAPHVIDNHRFYEPGGVNYSRDADEIRTDLGYASTDTVILFVGKFEPKKNPLLLLQAARKLPQFKFLFVGAGVLEKELKSRAESLTNVSFMPFQNQSVMPVTYRIGDIYVLPSQGPGETWGLAVNEAMACGIPAITSDKVGCTPDLIREGVTGYEFRSNDLHDLTEKIVLAAAHHRELGQKALDLIETFDIRSVGKTIVKNIV